MGEFIGVPGIPQVQQPTDSELCFAAIASSVTSESIDELHPTLVDAGISEADGSTTSPATPIEIRVGDADLFSEPVGGPFDSESFMERVNAKFEEGKAVALLHKKNDDPADTRNHWILLTGRYEDSGEALYIGVMDPLKSERTVEDVSYIEELVERTIEFNGGVFACALSANLYEPVS